MLRNVALSTVVIGFLMAGALHAASVDQAKTYLQNREVERARQELEEVLASDAADTEKAAALDLMASIAVEARDYATAADYWQRLLAAYPGRAEELGAATKLKLAEALIGQEAAEKQREPAPEEPTAPAPTMTEPEQPSPGPAAETAPPTPAPTPVPQAVRAQEPAAPRVPGLVLVAGTGKPYDAAQHAVAELATYLIENGVNTELPTGGIPVVESASTSMMRLLDAVEERGAESLVFMRVNFATVEKIVVELYSPDGALLWKVRVTGGTGHTGRPYSKTGVNENLMERFLEKFSKRVGGPGLPVSQ
jgi:tetratricopeptide (TPR) repeat protein